MILCFILEYEQINAHYDADITSDYYLGFLCSNFFKKAKRESIPWINEIMFYNHDTNLKQSPYRLTFTLGIMKGFFFK